MNSSFIVGAITRIVTIQVSINYCMPRADRLCQECGYLHDNTAHVYVCVCLSVSVRVGDRRTLLPSSTIIAAK